MEIALLVLTAFVSGWVCGHNWLFAKTAAAMSILAKMQRAAKTIDEHSRFVGDGFVSTYQAEFITGGKSYEITLSRITQGA